MERLFGLRGMRNADSERSWGMGREKLPKRFETHAPLHSTNERHRCWNADEEALVLRNQTLAAREPTEVLLLDFDAPLKQAAQDEELMITLSSALLLAGASILDLDSRELGTLLTPSGPQGRARGVVLYDGVAGGAGHVRELLERGDELLQRAIDVLWVSEEHDARCISGCLDCLMTFDRQMAARRPFKRREALSALRSLVTGAAIDAADEYDSAAVTETIGANVTSDNAVANAASGLSREERLDRAQQRTQRRAK